MRGQPVLVLATILGGWTIMRVLFWTSPFQAAAVVSSAFDPPAEVAERAEPRPLGQPHPGGTLAPTASEDRVAPWSPPEPLPRPFSAGDDFEAPPPAWLDKTPRPVPIAARSQADIRRIGSHYMLLAAGFANMTLPPEIAAFYAGQERAPTGLAQADRPLLGTGAASPARASRWSGDGWLLWRQGSSTSGPPGAPFYGRSQAGAVVRYRLSESALRPTAYVRGTRTIEGPRQAELASGLSIRPIASLPISVAAEARVTETGAGREVRPAVFAVTELPAADLPLGLRGEAYAQAGYVGGRFATAFVDGQARIDRSLTRTGSAADMRLGMAVWGGAQKGAARLDIGPSATIGFRLGEAQSRLAIDYRLRVAGDAEPRSGPAVTFSAGF